MKSPPSLSLADHRLLDLVWSSEPISSPQLCKLAQAQLGWKRTTTYTVIKRLGERGVLKHENGLVTPLISKEEAQVSELDALLEQKFQGSLPGLPGGLCPQAGSLRRGGGGDPPHHRK